MRCHPRRAGARWLQNAPEFVLDCFDSTEPGERYTVLFGGSLRVTADQQHYVSYLSMSGAPTHPQGVSMWGELRQHEAAEYRYRCGKQRVRWLDLPEHIRNHVIARVMRGRV